MPYVNVNVNVKVNELGSMEAARKQTLADAPRLSVYLFGIWVGMPSLL